MSKKFQRTIEDFTCEHCGVFVKGNGYTNHCPQCLWAKHVDIFPGDRLSTCQGLMKPVSFTRKKQSFVIIHTCVRCGYTGNNRMSDDDSIDSMVCLKQGKH